VYTEIQGQFERNLDSVKSVLGMDEELVTFTLTLLKGRQEKLKRLENPELDLTNAIRMVESIRKGGTLSKRFDVVRNQSVVLLVSYFGSALSDLFRLALKNRAATSTSKKLLDFELKLSIADLQQHDFNLVDAFTDYFVEKSAISFQDMGSTVRSFRDFLEVEIPKGAMMNNIIAAQGFRHVLVHAGARVDRKLVNQLASATPRALKPEIAFGDHIQFQDDEIALLIDEMTRFIGSLVQSLETTEPRNAA
jgi:hypothetical protein